MFQVCVEKCPGETKTLTDDTLDDIKPFCGPEVCHELT